MPRLILPRKPRLLRYPWLWVPRMYWAQRRCCCGECACSGTPPSQYQIVLGGNIGSGGFGGCGQANCETYLDTFVADYVGIVTDAGHPYRAVCEAHGDCDGWCMWRYEFTSPPCPYDLLDLCMLNAPSQPGQQQYVFLYDSANPTTAYARWLLVGEIDCALDNEEFVFNASAGESCVFHSVPTIDTTCHVTAA